MDTTTTPIPPARKVRAVKAPRAGSITAHIIATLAQHPGSGSRFLINQVQERHGAAVPLRTMSATLAILRGRGNLTSAPMPGAEHGQMVYTLTDRGRALAALMDA